MDATAQPIKRGRGRPPGAKNKPKVEGGDAVKLFGFEITKAVRPGTLSPPYSRSLWQTIIQEPYTGAWQRNDELVVGNVLDNWAVFACITLIASDIAKLRPDAAAADE